MIDSERLTAFLKRIHLFSGLRDDQLGTVAAQFTDSVYEAGKVVFDEGTQGDTFYLIFGGRAVVFRTRKKKGGQEAEEQQLAILVAGDYFGEEALLTNQRRSASIRIEEESILLKLPRRKFLALLKEIPQLKPNFQISVESRRLSRRLQFKWVHADEVIYFLARKHIILFYQAALPPILALALPAVLILGSLFLHLAILLWLAVVLIVIIAGILVWEWVDWGNDYYIVTNQRVVWLEKVVGLYDSRQESPLPTILSVSTETEPLGRSLDYGNVIIRTFVGRIVFHHVAHPYQVEALVKEHQGRARESSRRMEVNAMKQALVTRMNPSAETTAPSAAAPASAARLKPKKAPGPREGLFANFFKVRFEDREIITYRKHWFVLIEQLWIPSVVLLGLLILLAAGVYYLYFTPASQLPISGLERDTLFAVVLLALIGVLVWWIYQYVDWSNDIYQVTPDQILDIDRTPLGREQRTAAQLESILATDYERYGLLGIFLNYGTVHITVGGSKMTFHDVFDPASVQQDIDRRRMARNAAKEETRVKAERERLADWFLAYNEITNPETDETKRPDQN
ncbi:MAG TPA: cyclic nucleotide-binding domain-containing protein [Anaerolineales bacterium]|nr:cyclic nucleotide-binding domain-containing protein [Anaerolineales bacterium]